jgi:hypothetical protein
LRDRKLSPDAVSVRRQLPVWGCGNDAGK